MGEGEQGYTIIEIVLVLILVGVLSSYVAPRMFDQASYQGLGFHNEVQASLRYAQKVALAQRRFVCVTFSINTLSLTMGSTASCGTPLKHPQDGSNYVVTGATGIQFNLLPSNFYFTPQGEPSMGQSLQVVDSSRTITIEANSGYVH
ncbi:MAG: prepilin-type N-terminal cleavage/methylation domain-containing protein [Zetaproteobacteria bacterium]|nr:prepilin-type N-terminal cleavage/methylation domain-containing protein [Zetaproteobacteria bacterium]